MKEYKINIENHTFSVTLGKQEATVVWDSYDGRKYWVSVNPAREEDHPDLTGYYWKIDMLASDTMWESNLAYTKGYPSENTMMKYIEELARYEQQHN